MRKTMMVLLVLSLVLLLLPGAAISGNGYAWMADDDGDGIPNGDDPDYVPPLDGSGHKRQNGKPTLLSMILIELLGGDCVQLQLQLQDGSSGNCPDTCHVP